MIEEKHGEDDDDDKKSYARVIRELEPEIIPLSLAAFGDVKTCLRRVTSISHRQRVLVVDDYFYNLNSMTTLLQ